MKKIGKIVAILLFLSYFISTIVESNFWGNILSPIVTMLTFCVIFRSFFLNEKCRVIKVSGLFLSLGIFAWAFADILWAVCDLVLHIDPEQLIFITYSYDLTNLFFTVSMIIYGFYEFRKWNIVQIVLDSIVISACIIMLFWVIFFDKNIANVLALNNDWVSILAIILDVITSIAIAIWFFSVRKGKSPLFLRFESIGILIFVITDITYYYECFFSTYEPNTILDAYFIVAFALIAVAGIQKKRYNTNQQQTILHNVGEKGKGILLLIAPILLIVFNGFIVIYLLIMVTVIMLYLMLTNYIQKSIYKEDLFLKEKELNIELEHKVITRTEELLQKNNELNYLLNQDIITGLNNRRYFLARLEETISNLNIAERMVLLYIDLNRYKMMKTMYGNYIGDKVLSELAIRLKIMKEQHDNSILAAYGEDIFIFAIKGLYDYNHGMEFAKEAIQTCSDLYQIDEYQIRITVNIGISIYPLDANSKEELITHADIAMSQARTLGFNKTMAFDSKLSEAILRKNEIEIRLKKINFDQEFMLYFQPQVNTVDKKVIGFEALLRWKTPEGEFIPPSEFIPIAEETGYIVPVGDWVMKKAIEQAAEWNKRSKEIVTIGINVSIKQLYSIRFLEKLKAEMDRLSVQPEWIDIEITESIKLVENIEVMNELEKISNMGISISMDDFGTGYSSLGYLKNLPISRVKIAKELIDNIDKDDFDFQIVKSVIMISKVKDLKVIAEGVETAEQWSCLKEMQCDEIQGYLFGKPMSADEIEDKYMQ